MLTPEGRPSSCVHLYPVVVVVFLQVLWKWNFFSITFWCMLTAVQVKMGNSDRNFLLDFYLNPNSKVKVLLSFDCSSEYPTFLHTSTVLSCLFLNVLWTYFLIESLLCSHQVTRWKTRSLERHLK